MSILNGLTKNMGRQRKYEYAEGEDRKKVFYRNNKERLAKKRYEKYHNDMEYREKMKELYHKKKLVAMDENGKELQLMFFAKMRDKVLEMSVYKGRVIAILLPDSPWKTKSGRPLYTMEMAVQIKEALQNYQYPKFGNDFTQEVKERWEKIGYLTRVPRLSQE